MLMSQFMRKRNLNRYYNQMEHRVSHFLTRHRQMANVLIFLFQYHYYLFILVFHFLFLFKVFISNNYNLCLIQFHLRYVISPQQVDVVFKYLFCYRYFNSFICLNLSLIHHLTYQQDLHILVISYTHLIFYHHYFFFNF